jgi:protein TonB
MQAGIRGDVDFTITIDPDGHVTNAQLVRGHPLLVTAARDAVLQWTYRPILRNGVPVTAVTDVTVSFHQ